MEVRSLGPLKVASLLWQSPRGGWVLTVVAKATFDLLPGDARLSERQEEIVPSERHHEPGTHFAAPSDLAPFKPHADVIVVGHGYAPFEEQARPITARLVVAEVDKTLEIPAESRLEGALGGAARYALPHDPLGETPTFGPLIEAARARTERLGRNAGTWGAADLSDGPLPEDVEPGFFNAAPPDQRLQVLREDVVIALESLHPNQPRVTSKLPGVRARGFVEGAGVAEGTAADLRLAPDTLWINTDRAIATLTWRGQVLLEGPQHAGTVTVTVDHAARPLTWADVARTRAQLAVPAAPTSDAGLSAPPRGTEPGLRQVPSGLATREGLPFVAADALKAGASTPPMPPGQSGLIPQPSAAVQPQRSPTPPTGLAVTKPSPTPATPPVAAAAPPPGGPVSPRKVLTPQTEDVLTLAGAAASGKAPPWLAMYAAKKAAAKAGQPAAAPEAGAPGSRAPTPVSLDAGEGLGPVRSGTQPIEPAGGRPAEPAGARSAPVDAPGPRSAPVVAQAPAPEASAPRPTPASRPPMPSRPPTPSRPPAPSRPPPAAPRPLAAPASAPRTEVSSSRLQLVAFEEQDVAKLAPWREGEGDVAAAVRQALARAIVSDGAGLARAAAAAFDAEGIYEAPIARVDGELELIAEPLAWLRVLAATAAPFAAADPKVREVAGQCAAAGADTPLPLVEAMAAELTACLTRAAEVASRGEGGHTAIARRVADLDLMSSIGAAVAQQRRWVRRTVLGDRVVAARLRLLGRDDAVPAYLPEAFEARMPLAQRTHVAVFAAVHPRQDRTETAPLALRILAVATRVDGA